VQNPSSVTSLSLIQLRPDMTPFDVPKKACIRFLEVISKVSEWASHASAKQAYIHAHVCLCVCFFARVCSITLIPYNFYRSKATKEMARVYLVCMAVTLFFSVTFATETSVDEWAAEDDQAAMNNENEEQDMEKRGERALCSAKNEKYSR